MTCDINWLVIYVKTNKTVVYTIPFQPSDNSVICIRLRCNSLWTPGTSTYVPLNVSSPFTTVEPVSNAFCGTVFHKIRTINLNSNKTRQSFLFHACSCSGFNIVKWAKTSLTFNSCWWDCQHSENKNHNMLYVLHLSRIHKFHKSFICINNCVSYLLYNAYSM